MKFSALVVVGDGKGKVGFGLGKAAEVPEAIRKGIEDAKKNMITDRSVQGSTIPHEVIGEFAAGRVLMKPAPEGTGVIAGGPVRAVMEAAGIKNIRTKCLRSQQPAATLCHATIQGLLSPCVPLSRSQRSAARPSGSIWIRRTDAKWQICRYQARQEPQWQKYRSIMATAAVAGPAQDRRRHRSARQRLPPSGKIAKIGIPARRSPKSE